MMRYLVKWRSKIWLYLYGSLLFIHNMTTLSERDFVLVAGLMWPLLMPEISPLQICHNLLQFLTFYGKGNLFDKSI